MDRVITLILGGVVLMMLALLVVFASGSSLIKVSHDAQNSQNSAICQQEVSKYCDGDIKTVSDKCAGAAEERCPGRFDPGDVEGVINAIT